MSNPQIIPVWSNDENFFICKDFCSGKELEKVQRLKNDKGEIIPIFKKFLVKVKNNKHINNDAMISCILGSNSKISIIEKETEKVVGYLDYRDIEYIE